ncbi:MAG: hypothetical protein JWR33_2365 [Naasia sp.]|uniref:FtsK/SpoIIIE domain-containing protein n=1 Tax=Naasia sp. TaxID=2546198 RepID=UPI00260745AE|nr:FtsK/SpoIIIE domain-containing protein [Naasia sp.]MCU1571624.1 hypothetical protein [Naasia sp.]
MQLSLPPPLPEPPQRAFPIAGALAPVLAAGVLFTLTRSPITLAFAALGPLLAAASLLDGGRQARRATRRATERRLTALARLEEDVRVEHRRLLAALWTATPSAATILSATGPPVRRTPGPVLVALGAGPVPSGLELVATDEEDRAASARAAELTDGPVRADARDGIGVVGPQPLSSAVGRALRVQALWHSGEDLPVLVGHTADSLAEYCPVLLEVLGPRRAVLLRHPDPRALVELRPELVSRVQERRFRARMLRSASAGALPSDVPWAGLPPLEHTGGLTARFLVDEAGPVDLDLVGDGPHAVVGGTTGSGKSEFLVAWVVALAAAHPPERLSMLLLDFKGGSAFDRLAALDHVQAVVTDLDGDTVDRLADGLRAEVRRRETELRAARARDVDAAPGLARLVIVIDELAALLALRPALAGLLTDIAARGRALGMHLVLCTQRPAGLVSDALLANCPLRISLRVLQASDSSALVGGDDASRLPPDVPGRCVVSRAGEPAVLCQSAHAAPGDTDRALRRPPGRSPAPPVWLPPLPASLPLAGLPVPPAGQVVLGLLDDPGGQRQPLALWDPFRDASLLVVGAAGSGRSTVLATLAAQVGSAVVEGAGPDAGETLWDRVAGLGAAGMLLVDDLDLALSALGPEHSAELTARLSLALRRPGTRLAATSRSPAPPLRSLRPAFARTLLLRLDRDEHALLASRGERHDPELRPGGGWWDGLRLQAAQSPMASPAGGECAPVLLDASLAAALDPVADPLVLVTASPSLRIGQLAGHVGDRRVLDLRSAAPPAAGLDGSLVVLDPAAWQASPALWALLERRTLLLDGVSVAEFRAITRRRELPPPLAPREGRGWLVAPEQPARRVEVRWTGDQAASAASSSV